MELNTRVTITSVGRRTRWPPQTAEFSVKLDAVHGEIFKEKPRAALVIFKLSEIFSEISNFG